MTQPSFGAILRQARERKGLDFNATARRLRIRPDILKAIESSDFAAMPPRGYSRNMVNGYARYLGLNATEITGLYLDELYAYQVGQSRAIARPSGIDMSEADRHMMSRQRGATSRERRVSARGAQPDTATAELGLGARRRMTDDSDSAGRTASNRPVHPASRSVSPEPHYGSLYSGPSQSTSRFGGKLPIIIGAAVILILVIVIIVLLATRGGGSEDTSVPNVPVTGLSDATGSGGTQGQVTAVAPTQFTFTYTVADGAASWIEVHIDDEVKVAETVTGPSTQTFSCSGTLKFICANTTGVTIEQDGKPLTMQADDTGIVNMDINFSDVLAAWQKEHPGASTTTSTTTGTTAAATTTGTGTAATTTTTGTGATS